MIIDRRTLKQGAKNALRNARPNALLFTFVYLLLTGGISFLVGLVADPLTHLISLLQQGLDLPRALLVAVSGAGTLGLFLSILTLIFRVVLKFSYCQWCLGSSRGGIGEFADLICGFSMTGRVLLLRLAILMFSALWYFVIFIPALIGVVAAALIPGLGILLALVVLGTAMTLYLSRVLRYRMASYCLMDEPEKGAFHALYTSRKMMQGNCGQYFMLMLSFLGWRLLEALLIWVAETIVILVSGGLALLLNGDPVGLDTISRSLPMTIALTVASWPVSVWLTPYITMTECQFYDQMRNRASEV